ncbi:MAG: DUF192 domain-containing protein [Pseudomonadota bacterium]
MGKKLVGIWVCLILTLVIRAPAEAQSNLLEFDKDKLSIHTSSGDTHDFDVELAITGQQHAQGLMFRKRMAGDAGMLFIYPNLSERSMWMKNTLIPLDMLFMNGEGQILHIAERTVPGSLKVVSSRYPVRAVLELNGGTVARLGLAVGDYVEHGAFAAKD